MSVAAPQPLLDPQPESVPPSVTVVVAARDEEQFIEACVGSLLEMEDPPGGFELIVAEGGSDDQTRPLLDRLAANNPRLKVVANESIIAPAAWNVAIRQARGRYIAIMGANAEADGYLQRSNAASHHSPFSVGGASWHSLDYEGKARTVFGGFYRRDVFDRIGFFDEELVRDSDAEFNFRLERSGGTIWQSPLIRSWYKPRSTLGALFRQYRQYGYWKVRIVQKHGRTPAIRQYVPATFVSALMVLVAVAAMSSAISFGSPFASLARTALLVGAVTYAAVLGIASVTTAARYGWDLLPILPVTFASYHFGYGIGFLNGLYDFVLRKRTAPRRAMAELTR